MPLFLRGLELPDAEIRASVIDTFLAAAEGDPSDSDESLVSEHASTLVSTMLKNCLLEEMPSMVSSHLPQCSIVADAGL
jgi:DNA repair/transcription protein MET18/MMS19